MYRLKTLTAARRSLRLNPALPSLSRTYVSRSAAKKGKIRRGDLPKNGVATNVRKVLQSENVATLTCEPSASGGICDVFVVGTSHGCPESKREVEDVIKFLKPEVIFLEMCSSRCTVINHQPGCSDPHNVHVKKKVGQLTDKNKFEVKVKGVGNKHKQGRTVKLSGPDVAGCEFAAAYMQAILYGRKVILGDRPLEITELRAARCVSEWELIKLLYYEKFSNESPSHKLSKSKLMESYDKVMVDERDQYMSAKLLEAARQHSSIVAVVGRDHLEGIQKNWKQPVELEQLLVVPRDPLILPICMSAAVTVSTALVLCYYIKGIA